MISQTAINIVNMEVQSKYHVSNERMAEEQAIIDLAKKDPAKFESLYERYHEQIFRYAYQRIDDKDLCHDVTQQVFLKALTSLHKYEFRGVPFSSWLYRIAQSEVYQALRDKQAERCVSLNENMTAEMMDEVEDNKMGKEIQYERVAKAVAQLEEEDLQLVEMRFMEKRPFKEVAEILGITENNAKVKLYRALEKLKKILIKKQTFW